MRLRASCALTRAFIDSHQYRYMSTLPRSRAYRHKASRLFGDLLKAPRALKGSPNPNTLPNFAVALEQCFLCRLPHLRTFRLSTGTRAPSSNSVHYTSRPATALILTESWLPALIKLRYGLPPLVLFVC